MTNCLQTVVECDIARFWNESRGPLPNIFEILWGAQGISCQLPCHRHFSPAFRNPVISRSACEIHQFVHIDVDPATRPQVYCCLLLCSLHRPYVYLNRHVGHQRLLRLICYFRYEYHPRHFIRISSDLVRFSCLESAFPGSHQVSNLDQTWIPVFDPLHSYGHLTFQISVYIFLCSGLVECNSTACTAQRVVEKLWKNFQRLYLSRYQASLDTVGCHVELSTLQVYLNNTRGVQTFWLLRSPSEPTSFCSEISLVPTVRIFFPLWKTLQALCSWIKTCILFCAFMNVITGLRDGVLNKILYIKQSVKEGNWSGVPASKSEYFVL